MSLCDDHYWSDWLEFIAVRGRGDGSRGDGDLHTYALLYVVSK